MQNVEMGWLGIIRVTQGHWKLHQSFELTTPVFGAPVWGDPLEFRLNFWHQKNRVPGLSYGVVCVILHLAVLIQYRRVTDSLDRQTDGRTTTAYTALA